MSGGSTPFRAPDSGPASVSPGSWKLATWPKACTPASVRPATETEGDVPLTCSIAATSVPSTVRNPGWAAQPANPAPSYSSVSLSRPPVSDELDVHHLGRVRAPRAQLQDAGVASRPRFVARRDLLEQLVHDELVLAERGQRLPARVEVAPLGERDQLLDLRLDHLGLGLAGAHPLVLDHLATEVLDQRLAVTCVPRQLVALLLMSH